MSDIFLTPYIQQFWTNLQYKYGSQASVALFPGGQHSDWLIRLLATFYNYQNKTTSKGVDVNLIKPAIKTIVDDNPKHSSLHGIPIVTPDKLQSRETDLLVISSDTWEEKLYQKATGFFPENRIVRLYKNIPEGPYDKTLSQAYSSEQLLSSQSLQKSNLSYSDKCPVPADPKKVVLVSDQPRSREAKIGLAIKHAGFYPVLVYRKEPTFLTSRIFFESHKYSHYSQAADIVSAQNASYVHVFVNSDYRTARVLIDSDVNRIFLDSYDIIKGMYSDEYLDQRPALSQQISNEEYCLLHSDGIITRSTEINHQFDSQTIHKKPAMFLEDGCWHQHLNKKKKISHSDEIHIVYVGNMSCEKFSKDIFDSFGYKLWLAKSLSDQEIHFHLYPSFDATSDSFEEYFSDYIQLDNKNEYFHLHQSIPADKLIEEISRYDAGIFVYNDLVFGRNSMETFTDLKMKCCTTNKVYDYFDAGLPVVHNLPTGRHLRSIIDKYDTGIYVGHVAPEHWGQVLRDTNWKEKIQNANQAAQGFDVRHRSTDLIQFYQDTTSSVMNKKKRESIHA